MSTAGIEVGQEIYGDVRRMGKGFALPASRVMDAQRKSRCSKEQRLYVGFYVGQNPEINLSC
jgi:hypothetical protein